MNDKERQFFDRKLEATKNDEEAHDKVIAAVVKRCVLETLNKQKMERERETKRENAKVNISFGL